MKSLPPCLIIVTGRPAAGKSTLAQWLGRELKLPVISKDSVREVLFDQLGWKDREWARQLGRASVAILFHMAEVQLRAGQSVILDNAFDPVSSAPRFHALVDGLNVKVVQIVCSANTDILFERFVSRAQSGQRHPGHGNDVVLSELRMHLEEERSMVMKIGGTIVTVDTNDFAKVNHDMILARVCEEMVQNQR